MSKRLLSIEVRGRAKRWSFSFYADPRYIPEWQADGLDVRPILNVIPAWWVGMGLPASWWCFLQDVWNFKNPWSKS